MYRYIPILLICIACTMPTADIQGTQETVSREPLTVVEPVEYTESWYVYTIIGTWERCFDNHREFYVFSEDTLTTYCDGVCNGLYDIEHTEDWTFVLCQTVFDYELMCRDGMSDRLILGGYEYERMD